MTPETSIYLHIPFCLHRCAYCDFNAYAGQEDSIPAYVEALIREIEFVGLSASRHCEDREARRRRGALPDEAIPAQGRGLLREDHPRNDETGEDARLPSPDFGRGVGGEGRVHTIFFGGGTPSLLSAYQLASIMDALRANFAFTGDIEATLEANPGTTSPEFLRQIREAGINRLSFGVQSANPGELRMLERAHDFFDVIDSVKWARQAGFSNLNLDLIYGLPEQTLARWQNSVRRIVDLGPEHVSMYALTLEHGTPFGRWSAKGLLPLPNPDLAADMYEWADEFLSANGYVQYEISNWARGVESRKSKVYSGDPRPSTFDSLPEFACKHNLQYWRNLPYLGLGAGAHGFANGVRYSNVLRIKTYIERLTQYEIRNAGTQVDTYTGKQVSQYDFPLTPAVVNHHKLSEREQMQETMLTGLRLTREGVSDAAFRLRFGMGIAEAFPKEGDELLRLGLVEWVKQETSEVFETSEVLRLTSHARLVANQAFMRFVD
ncbi:MAG: coproporphyrinogen-III oxidase family protein [Chloroflexota bacterium]